MRSLLAVLLFFASALPAHVVRAQNADVYRGTVVNSGLRDHPATLELSIFQRSDTLTTGWLEIGKPLGGSGLGTVVLRDLDSLYLVTVSPTNDTIVWASGTRSGTLGGVYWIKGGRYAGQGGTWRLEPQPHLSVAALTLVALFIAVAVLLALYVMSTYACAPWWRWRTRTPLPALTSQQRQNLSSVGGWLALIVVSSGFVMVYLLFSIGEVGDSLGSTWRLATAVPAMRGMLLIESVAHLFQLMGLATGIVLILRRSPVAPPFWVGFLALLALYVLWDGAAAPALANTLTERLGTGGAEMTRQVSATEAQNRQTLLRAAIWALYWIKSKRVRLTFSPFPESSTALGEAVVEPGAQTALAR